MRIAISLVVLCCLAVGTSPIWAEDKEGVDREDIGALLRQAIVVQDVDKDNERARDLYRRIWSLAPDSAIGLQAGLRLVRLLENRAQRLPLWKDITKRHTARMTDEVKHQVHNAMLSLGKPGDMLTTPLGLLYIAKGDQEFTAVRSPVEAQLARIMKAHNVRSIPFRPANAGAQRDLERELEELGEAGRLALVRMVDEGHPDEAFAAGILLLADDPATAIRGYARAIREGRANFRSQVVGAALRLPSSPELSPALIAAFLPLLEVKDIDHVHASVRQILGRHMTDQQLLERAALDEDMRIAWFQLALQRDLPEAVAALTKEAALLDAPTWLLPKLQSRFTIHSRADNKDVFTLDIEKVDTDTLATLIRLTADASLAGNHANYRFWRVRDELKRRKAWDPLRLELVRRAFDHDDATARQSLLNMAQHHHGIGLSEETLTEDGDWDRLVELLIDRKNKGLRASWMKGSERLWRAVLERIRQGDRDERKRLEQGIRESLGDVVPESLQPLCLEILESLEFSPTWQGEPNWVWWAGAKTGDPRFLALVEKNLEHLHKRYGVKNALGAYTKPDAVPFAMRVLDAEPSGLDDWALATLYRHRADPAVWARLVAGAKQPEGARVIVGLLKGESARQRALLREIYEWAAKDAALLGTENELSHVRAVLIRRANELHMREAIPFLLRVYNAPFNEAERKSVMAAMDSIRDHHDRLKFFESWGRDVSGETKVLEMLDDEDAAIRRAAVMSLAAMQGPRALPRLLEVAKTDKDEGVRKAALEAIERVAVGEGKK